MLIASLERLTFLSSGDVVYCATDPFDGEILTAWHDTIMQVQKELEDNDSDYGLMTACYQGESDVPARPREVGSYITEGTVEPSGCNPIPCS